MGDQVCIFIRLWIMNGPNWVVNPGLSHIAVFLSESFFFSDCACQHVGV